MRLSILEQNQKAILEIALRLTKGNKTKTAKILSVSIRTIRKWCHKFQLTEYIYPDYAHENRIKKPEEDTRIE